MMTLHLPHKSNHLSTSINWTCLKSYYQWISSRISMNSFTVLSNLMLGLARLPRDQKLLRLRQTAVLLSSILLILHKRSGSRAVTSLSNVCLVMLIQRTRNDTLVVLLVFSDLHLKTIIDSMSQLMESWERTSSSM